MAALLFGFPIFFDAGLVVFLPIILTVARRFGGSVLYYALPAAGAFAAMHAIVPPHPGPVAAGTALGGDIGVILLVGVPVAVIAWYVGVYLVSRVSWAPASTYPSRPAVRRGQRRPRLVPAAARPQDGSPGGTAADGTPVARLRRTGHAPWRAPRRRSAPCSACC